MAKKSRDVADPSKPLFGFSTAKEFLDYVEELPPEMQTAITKEIWKRPDIMVEAVKTLRKMAADPTLPADIRAKTQRLAKQYGFDDETLRKESGTERVNDDE